METSIAVYIGPYKVVKVFKKSGRRQVLRRGLTRDEAKLVVKGYPSRSTSMVVFMQQFSSSKYYR